MTAVAMKDMSLLSPLSVKDAIWIDVAVSLRRKEEIEFENDKVKFIGEQFETLGELLMDVRHIAIHTDTYVQLAALKESKHPKISAIELEELPSHYFAEARKKREGEKKDAPAAAKDGASSEPAKPAKKKKYATYKEYLEAEEKDNQEEQDRLYRNAVNFTNHVRELERRQGGLEKSRTVRQMESEEERLAKIRAEREKSKKSENG